MEGFERFAEGDVPADELTKREYDVLGAQLYGGVVPASLKSQTYFGNAVAMSSDGTTAIVGAYRDSDQQSVGTGSAYVFKKIASEWVGVAKLTPDDGAELDQFGFSVAISGNGNTAVVGSNRNGSGGSLYGAAYVFDLVGSEWVLSAKLTAPTQVVGTSFGHSVAISDDGDTVVVGNHTDTGRVAQTGAAYVFIRSGSTWVHQQKLTAPDGGNLDQFGFSVDVSGNGLNIVVGAPFDDDGGTNAGTVWVFIKSGDTWVQQLKLPAPSPTVNANFGHAVSMSYDGNRMALLRRGSGIAYVYSRSGVTWTQSGYATRTGLRAFETLRLSRSGNRLIIGSVENSGSAYVYVNLTVANMTPWRTIAASDSATGARFGNAVALSSDGMVAAIGSPNISVQGVSQVGQAYLYDGVNLLTESIVKPLSEGATPGPQAGTISVSSASGHMRGRGFKYSRTTADTNAQMAAGRFKLPSNAWTQRIIGFAIKLNTVGSATVIAGFASDASSAAEIHAAASIAVQTTAPYLRLNTTPFSEAATLGEWSYVELLIDRTALTVTAYMNGSQVASGAITAADADNMGRFAFEIATNAANLDFDIDDFYFMDDVDETQPIAPIGMCKVDLMPVDTVVSAAWTPQPSGTTTPEALAVPLNPDTYVESASDGAADVLGHGFIDGGPEATDDVLRVQAVSVVTLSEDAPQVTTGLTVGETTKTVTSSGAPDETVVLRVTADVTMKASALADVQSGYAVGSDW